MVRLLLRDKNHIQKTRRRTWNRVRSMESSSLHLQALIAFGILFTILCLSLVMAKSKFRKKKGTPPPEAAGAWPLIGHLHLVEANKPLHQTLGAMADKYGPAFSIRLGVQQALVVSSWEVAKECFTANDKVFSSRPQSLALKIMAYDHAVLGFAPYGPYWRNLRKLVVIELLSNYRLEMFKHVRDSEINIFMKEAYDKWVGDGDKNPVLVEMKGKFWDLATNVVLRVVVGKRYFFFILLFLDSFEFVLFSFRIAYISFVLLLLLTKFPLFRKKKRYAGSGNEELRRFQQAIEEFTLLIGIPMVSDAIPLLGWLDALNGYRGEMKRSARGMDVVLQEWLEEHRRKRLTGRIDDGERYFIDVMLSVMEEKEAEGRHSHSPCNTDTIVKATCLVCP